MSKSYAVVYYTYKEEFRCGVILVEDSYKSAFIIESFKYE